MTFEKNPKFDPQKCPGLMSAKKCEDRSMCAPMVRKNYVGPPFLRRPLSWLLGIDNAYYVWPIVDKNGKQVEPYFEDWAKDFKKIYKPEPKLECQHVKDYEALGHKFMGEDANLKNIINTLWDI